MTYFSTFMMLLHCLLIYIVSDKKSVILLFLYSSMWIAFFLWLIFQVFYLLLVSAKYIMMCLCVAFFVSLMFGVHWAPRTCECIISIKFRKFWAIIFLIFLTYALSSSETPITHLLCCLKFSQLLLTAALFHWKKQKNLFLSVLHFM